MEKEQIFTPIKEISEEQISQEKEELKTENPFIIGLPQWDLEPPYETIQRGNKLWAIMSG